MGASGHVMTRVVPKLIIGYRASSLGCGRGRPRPHPHAGGVFSDQVRLRASIYSWCERPRAFLCKALLKNDAICGAKWIYLGLCSLTSSLGHEMKTVEGAVMCSAGACAVFVDPAHSHHTGSLVFYMRVLYIRRRLSFEAFSVSHSPR